MTTPHKLVDGEEVPLSETEIAQRDAEAKLFGEAQLAAHFRRKLLQHINAALARDETLQRLMSMSSEELEAWLVSGMEARPVLRLLLLLELRRQL